MAGKPVNRRKFMAGVAISGAATAVPTADAAATLSAPADATRRPSALRPTAVVAAAEDLTPKSEGAPAGVPGSDFMLDVIKSLKIEYIAQNPAQSFRGLHESIITYGNNKSPELLTCLHEESAVAMAHGYFKVAGKPMAVLVHGTVGLQHAAMAVYNAWCDRVPVIILGGNDLDASKRPGLVGTYHTAQDVGALVRDFVKWDDTPVSLQHFAESFVRAYKISMTPPYEPVFLTLLQDLQEETAHEPKKLKIPRYVPTAPPQGDSGAVREAARLLVNAQNPVIVADRAARTENGMKLLVELAEALSAPVIDQASRMNMPNTHFLQQTGRSNVLVQQADVIIGLELSDFWGTVTQYIDNGHGLQQTRIKEGTKLINISSGELYHKSNYQDFQRFISVDVPIAGDAEATLPALLENVKSLLTPERKAVLAQRAASLRKAYAAMRDRERLAASYGWDVSPISLPRLHAELWAVMKDEDWALVGTHKPRSWANTMWKMNRFHHHVGQSGGYGLGYAASAAVGSALAHRAHGRVSVNIQPDGDLMYANGCLWTAVHHKVPMLNVMYNNRSYHQEVMHVQRMANRRDRVLKDGPIGTTIDNPNIDYVKLAQSMGMQGIGSIENPSELAPALRRAMQIVKAGEPVLVDVVTQPR